MKNILFTFVQGAAEGLCRKARLGKHRSHFRYASALALILTTSAFAADDGAVSGIHVDVPAGDVREVLRSVADAAGISVVIPGELSGSVSLKLDAVSYAEAFAAILSPRGYGFRVLPSGFVVIEQRKYPTTVVQLRYAAGSAVVTAMAKVLRSGETLQSVGTAVVIEAETERAVSLVALVSGIDHPLRQVLVECRFQEMSSVLSRSLGINWNSLGALSIGAELNPVQVGTAPAWGAVLKAGQLSAILSMLDTTAGTRVLSRPTLLASEGREATVSVGQQYPLPQYTFSQEQSVLQVSGFQFKDIGVLLKVTPRFSGDRIVLDLEPEVSSVTATTTFAGAGAATLPIIATRRIKTQVELADGDTMAISGLVSSEAMDGTASVRGLGKIPLLGSLFRHRDNGKNSSELVVFVSVRLVQKAADARTAFTD